MKTGEALDRSHASRISLPRWAAVIVALVVWLVMIPLVHGLLPWALSLMAPRLGWGGARPGIGNLPGLLLVGSAAACLVWVLVVGLGQTPKRVALEWNAPSLLTHGPYAFTRNPMYVAELGLWLGWALFYRSLVVLAGFGVLWAVVSAVVLPREERALEARFGECYVRYKSAVPRWLGRVPH